MSADTFPRWENGQLIFACCVSSVGPQCQHIAAPDDDDEQFSAADFTMYDVWDHLDGLGWFVQRAFDQRDAGEIAQINRMIQQLADRMRELIPVRAVPITDAALMTLIHNNRKD